jgi:hypothetical protein
MQRGMLGAVIAVLAITVASCGGNKPTTQSSRSEFQRQADATCRQAKTEMTAVLRSPQAARASQRELADLVAKTVVRQRQMIADLGAIKPPDGLTAGYREYVATLRAENSMTQQAVDKVRGGGAAPTPGSSEPRRDLSHKAVRLAKAVGLRFCGA